MTKLKFSQLQYIAIYCNVSDENGESGHRITKEDIEKKLNLEIEDDTKYVEAELSFQWLRFETNKSMQDENPMRTMAYGYVEKIK